MANTEMKTAAGFLLAGALVGAAAALLYAPKSGVQTKKDIKNFARKTIDRLEDLQSEIRDSVVDWTDELAGTVKDAVDRGQDLSTDGYEQVLRGFDSLRKGVEAGRSRFEKMIKTA